MSRFKKGQKVWAFTYGWGVVSEVDSENCPDYPVGVQFNDGGINSFTLDGRYTTEEHRTLFFKEIPIPEEALVPPMEEITLQQGDIVALRSGALGYVGQYSGPTDTVFTFHETIPHNLDDAFNSTTLLKNTINKVVGNINAQ